MKRFFTLVLSALLLFGCKSDDETLYSYTVSFDVQGESYLSPVSVIYGSTVARPSDPSVDGYLFDDWYSDPAFSELWDFDTPVTADMTLYANLYTIPTLNNGDIFEIYSVSDLKMFRILVNDIGAPALDAMLMNDIDLSGEVWTPIGSLLSPYLGLFSGNHHTIKGLTIDASTSDCQALFGCVNGGTIKNLVIESAQVTGSTSVGAVVGYLRNATVAVCGLYSGTVEGGSNIGGVVGYADSTSYIYSCYNLGFVEGSGSNVGGVVGGTEGYIITSYNEGSVLGTTNVGGVIGCSTFHLTSSTLPDYSEFLDYNIISCYNTGPVVGNSHFVGGVVGTSHTPINLCYNTGLAMGRSGCVGGIVGFYTSSVNSCYNSGAVSGNSNGAVGGICGYTESSNSTVTSCYNRGAVSAKYSAGGIVGDAGSCTTIIRACYNTGSVAITSKNAGGIIGLADIVSIYSCHNIGSISGGSYLDGIVAYPYTAASVVDCYYQSSWQYQNKYGIQTDDMESMMKSSSFVTTLNAIAGGERFESDLSGVNDGYPILINLDYE